jgi:hypothetical protein
MYDIKSHGKKLHMIVSKLVWSLQDTTRIKTTDEQTDMQHLGQKKKKNGKSANTKSALQEPPKNDTSADIHATNLIFWDTLPRYNMLYWYSKKELNTSVELLFVVLVQHVVP